MSEELKNPRLLEVGYRKEKANPFAMKMYFPYVGEVIRIPCRTATEAQTKAVRIWDHMCDEYDAAILEMSNPSPAVTEEGQVVTE